MLTLLEASWSFLMMEYRSDVAFACQSASRPFTDLIMGRVPLCPFTGLQKKAFSGRLLVLYGSLRSFLSFESGIHFFNRLSGYPNENYKGFK